MKKEIPIKDLLKNIFYLKPSLKDTYIRLMWNVMDRGQDGFTDEKYINIPNSIKGNIDGKKTLFHQLSIDTKTGVLYLYQINELDEGYHVSLFSLTSRDFIRIMNELKKQLL